MALGPGDNAAAVAVAEVPPAAMPQQVGVSLWGVAARLIKGSAVYAVANFAVKAFNFFLIPLYTRFLTPADYGIVSLAETVAAAVALFASLGLTGAISRLYFQYVGDHARLASYLGSVLRTALACMVVATGVALWLGGPALRVLDPHFSVPFYPFIAIALLTAALTKPLEYQLCLFQCEEKPRRYARLSVGFFLLTAAGVIALVVLKRWGALGMLLGKMAAAVIVGGVALAMLLRWLRAKWESGYVRETVPLAVPLALYEFMALGLIAADRFILEHYRSLQEVGLYSVAYTFGMMMYIVTYSLMQAWSPLFFDTARHGDEGRRILGRLNSALAVFLCGIATFGVLVARPFVNVGLAAAYREVGPVVPIIIAGYLFHGIFVLFQKSALQAKAAASIWWVSVVAMAANIGLNFWWIPRWGMYGAAWATVAAYALEAGLMFRSAQKSYAMSHRRVQVLAGFAIFAGALAISQSRWGASHPWIALAGGGGIALVLLAVACGRSVLEVRRLWANRAALG